MTTPRVATWIALLACSLAPALAAAWPDRTVRMVVPFAPGGATDGAMRIVAPKLALILGQAVVVENQAGAGGIVGTSAVAKARADGHVFLVGSAANAITAATNKDLAFDFERDLVPVAMMADVPGVLIVGRDVPARSVKELIEHLKANPGKATFGSPGVGTTVHMAGELFARKTGTTMLHVPYKGASAALTDLLGGQIDLMFPALAAVQPQIREGRVRVLAVTSRARTPLAPDIPTVAEAGVPGYEVGAWIGLFAPRGTPEPAIAALRSALAQVLADPATREAFTRLGIEPRKLSPDDFRRLVGEEIARWK